MKSRGLRWNGVFAGSRAAKRIVLGATDLAHGGHYEM